ncbi:hypothetical protein AOLI_G00053610 [Acnodon oligacanthus]
MFSQNRGAPLQSVGCAPLLIFLQFSWALLIQVWRESTTPTQIQGGQLGSLLEPCCRGTRGFGETLQKIWIKYCSSDL